MGFEPMICAVKGRYPKPLDEGSIKFGAGVGNRTRVKLVKAYLASTPALNCLAICAGVEPAISCVTGKRLNQFDLQTFCLLDIIFYANPSSCKRT